jgi:hypothetical protein
MINEQWLQANAAVVPDDAVIFVRHPRHFIIRIDRIGWTRFNAEDAQDVSVKLHWNHGRKRIVDVAASKANPERIVEHSCAAARLKEDRNLQASFRTCFGEDESISGAIDLLRMVFPEADQVILLVSGGASWFIWGLKEEVTR